MTCGLKQYTWLPPILFFSGSGISGDNDVAGPETLRIKDQVPALNVPHTRLYLDTQALRLRTFIHTSFLLW